MGVFSLDAGQNTLTELCEFQSEFEKQEKDRYQNFAKYSPDGSVIVTGGSDGLLKLWKAGKPNEAPELQSTSQQCKELIDVDFSPDGKFLAATDNAGACRIYNVAKGVEAEVLQLKLASRLVKGALFMKRIRFIKGEDGSNQILIG